MNLSVRKARMGDIRAIHALLMTSSADGLLLPRSLTDLYGHLRDFFVVEGDGATVGCGALSIIWENMAEVRSLAVAAHARRKGCGRLIVEACIAEARELDIHRLFALTQGFGETIAQRRALAHALRVAQQRDRQLGDDLDVRAAGAITGPIALGTT